jgi:hypothetical protein
VKLTDPEYYHRRAEQEQTAAQKAICPVAWDRHRELAAMYRLRVAMLTSAPELWLEESSPTRAVDQLSRADGR